MRPGAHGPCCFSHSSLVLRLWRLWKIRSENSLNASRSRVRGVANRRTVTPRSAVGAFRVLVLPGDVVARARRQHVHLVVIGQPLGDQPAVVLGSAEDLGAVALDDECNSSRVGDLSPS